MAHLTPLRIDTELSHDRLEVPTTPSHASSASGSITPPASPKGQYSTLNVPSSPNTEKGSSSLWPQASLKSANRRNESRKLLSHLLDQLRGRPMPPRVHDAMFTKHTKPGTKLNVLVGTVRGAVKLANKSNSRLPYEEDPDEEEPDDGTFSTDVSFDLMLQLKDVLSVSILQGWQIFEERETPRPQRRSKVSSPFRRSVSPGNSRSRSPGPHPAEFEAPKLLSQCISILSSIIAEDCRYRLRNYSPLRPPHSLQAISLEIARFMLHIHRGDSKVVSDIAFALIPAFVTFPSEMHPRLLLFFEESILRVNLEDLFEVHGPNDMKTHPAEAGDDPRNSLVSIRIEEPQEDASPQQSWPPWSTRHSRTILSSHSPHQPLDLYYVSSLVAPLLASLFENVDFLTHSRPRIDIMHRMQRLLNLLVDMKPDLYLDILDVVAYRSASARQAACAILLTYWPKDIGHVTVSSPFPSSRFHEFLAEGRNHPPTPQDHPYAHQFVPWRFSSLASPTTCRACSKDVTDFGLICPFCFTAVHFDCYDHPEGSHLVNYTDERDITRLALFRFSDILPVQRATNHRVIVGNGHSFRPLNFFTLSLCLVCQCPLWGCSMQGLGCASCLHFVHEACVGSPELPHCASVALKSNRIMIGWASLRQSCLDFWGRALTLQEDEIQAMSYEDVSILEGSLWVQSQILAHGLALGSIVVRKGHTRDDSNAIEEFELHHVLRLLQEARAVESHPNVSFTMDDYLVENRRISSQYDLMFDWAGLCYITTSLKVSASVPSHFAADSVSGQAVSNYPAEMITLGQARDTLGHAFQVQSDIAAKHLLSHLHHLSFISCDRAPLSAITTAGVVTEEIKAALCSFGLPLGLDLSVDVETLFTAVESCLEDLDVNVNEVGLLLLTRRLWPSGMASDYSTRRLMLSLIRWILAEDDRLATILRDYLSKRREFPGVRSSTDPLPWPSIQSSRITPQSSVNNGGDYLAVRSSISSKYIVPWMQAVHDQDNASYVSVLYELCEELALEESRGHSEKAKMSPEVARQDNILRVVSRLGQGNVLFTSFDALFWQWMQSVVDADLYVKPMPSLYRIFAREVDAGHRFSAAGDASAAQSAGFNLVSLLNPWRKIIAIAKQNKQALLNAFRWLTSLSSTMEMTFEECDDLLKALLCSVWLRSIGKYDLQKAMEELHGRLAVSLDEHLKDESRAMLSYHFVRRSLAVCLLLYGCDRKAIVELGFMLQEEIELLPARRRLNTRGSASADPLAVSSGTIKALQVFMATSSTMKVDIICMIAKFFNAFLTRSPFLESYEVDNFILRNGKILATTVWHLYGLQRHDIASVRSELLLRVAVVDFQPLKDVLEISKSEKDWQLRLFAGIRVFRMILDGPSFHLEGRQWRSSLVNLFYFYFNMLWSDEKEEIRSSMEISASTLMPLHQESISMCWNELMSKAPVSERVQLVGFLIQLRPHFPAWQVLSWETIVETLKQESFDMAHGTGESSGDAAYLSYYGLDEDNEKEESKANTASPKNSSTLSVSTLALALSMASDGILIDFPTVLSLKEHLVRHLGFDNISLRPSANGQSFFVEFDQAKEIPGRSLPCIHELCLVLDSPHPLDLASLGLGLHGQDGTTAPLLVGSPFVDVSLSLFCTVAELSSLPVLTLKDMLESIAIIIYKHDFEKTLLRPQQQMLRKAVMRTLNLVVEEINYECRQLALSVAHAYIKRWPNSSGGVITFAIEQCMDLVVSYGDVAQDVLIGQAKNVLEHLLSSYAMQGVLLGVLKRPREAEYFAILRNVVDSATKRCESTEHLRVVLLRDCLSRSLEIDISLLSVVNSNLFLYVQVVHNQGYTAEAMSYVGRHITQLARRVCELSSDMGDPAPLLKVLSLLTERNTAHSKDMLSYLDTTLRICLHRLDVSSMSLSSLIKMTETLKTSTKSGENPADSFIGIIFEILSDALRLKSRVSSKTLTAMTEVMSSKAATHRSYLLALSESALYFLQNQMWIDNRIENDYNAAIALSRMILDVSPQSLGQMVDFEKSSKANTNVRAWNVVATAALTDGSQEALGAVLQHLPAYSTAYHVVIRGYLQAGSSPTETAVTDINHAYIGIKLWLLLAQKHIGPNSTTRIISVWTELWPPFERLVELLISEVQEGLSITLAMLTWSTVADIFMFVRTLRIPMTLESGFQSALLNRLRALGKGQANAGKITRTLKAMTEPPPDVSHEAMVNQIAQEMIAAEKLRVLNASTR